MSTIPKGLNTRLEILEKARKILNERGIWITQDMLVKEMDIGKSRVTNHFPTKDSLFKAILQEYEMELASMLNILIPTPETVSFQILGNNLSRIMDIQYEYRCGMAYISLINHSQREIYDDVSGRYQKNLELIRLRLQLMVRKKLLLPEILEPAAFKLFSIQYVHLLTTWIFNLELYYSKEGYRKMKPLYLQTALSCFIPYCTKKGLQELESIPFKKIANTRF